jgi:hypothetical protein
LRSLNANHTTPIDTVLNCHHCANSTQKMYDSLPLQLSRDVG